MVKRRDLLKTLERMARIRGLPVEYREGGSHTVIKIGNKQTVVPRHSEVNEITARKIIKQIGE